MTDAVADLKPALEAVLMVSDQPLDDHALAAVVGHPPRRVAAALGELAAEYTAQGRGFDLCHTGAGWRFYSRADQAAVVARFARDGRPTRLTQAALETLAVVAYRQPVSRGSVAAIRGVDVDAVMRTLVARGLVEEAGQDAQTGAVLYRTTTYFLERLGLSRLDELPPLAPLLPELADLEPDEAAAR